MIETKLVQKEIDIVKEKIINFACESKQLQSLLNDFLSRESKMIRTITAALFIKAAGEELNNEQLEILAATELIHNASLIHDDVIDESVLRRNDITLNKQFGNKFSIIAGDYVLSLAVKQLLNLSNEDILQIYFDVIPKMCEGESLQYFQKGKIPALEDYIKKTQYKTAELFKACFVSLALYSQKGMLAEAKEFAMNFGIAFQIRNDLNDYRLGIDSSADIKQGVYTAPIILSNSVENSEAAIEKTLDLIDNYCQRAKLALMSFPDSEYSAYLTELVDKLCS